MKILVCIKQVADVDSSLKINSDYTWIVEDNKIAYRMNRYDEYALEEALLIKDADPETAVDVISIGPERAAAAVKKSLEKGADSGVHILCINPAISAAETASVIAEYASDKNYDIIFAGVMSEDLMQCQVGPMVAENLTLPSAVSVVKLNLINDLNIISADSELEGGVVENIEISLPCLIAVQTGMHQPRYPSLSNVMRARSMEIITLNIENFKTSMSFEKIVSVDYPPVSSKGIIINGTSENKADRLLDLLHEKALL